MAVDWYGLFQFGGVMEVKIGEEYGAWMDSETMMHVDAITAKTGDSSSITI